MIKSTGVIPAQDGIGEYKNQVITVYMVSPSKYQPTLGVAQLGKYAEATETRPANFTPIAQVGAYSHVGANPSFEEVQATVLAGLQADYPNVIFEII
jgi:hypothetical protein